jgi:hypothetical protein
MRAGLRRRQRVGNHTRIVVPLAYEASVLFGLVNAVLPLDLHMIGAASTRSPEVLLAQA